MGNNEERSMSFFKWIDMDIYHTLLKGSKIWRTKTNRYGLKISGVGVIIIRNEQQSMHERAYGASVQLISDSLITTTINAWDWEFAAQVGGIYAFQVWSTVYVSVKQPKQQIYKHLLIC